MTISTTDSIFTAEQQRRVRDNIPVLSNRPDGNVDLTEEINDWAALVEADLTALDNRVGTQTTEDQILTARGTIPMASVRTLNATPVTMVAAPGAGLYIEPVSCHWWLDYGTATYDGAAAGDTLGAKYTDGSGAQLLDTVAGNAIGAAAADYHANVSRAVEIVPVANAAVVAHIDAGEWYVAAGDSPLKYEFKYRVRTLEFTAA
jgi:hypothetical protein